MKALVAHITAQPTLRLEGARRAVAAATPRACAHGAPGAAFFDERCKQLALSGVYSGSDDRLRPEIEGPNGIVLPPLQPRIRP
jgi:hypothetical protein